MNNKHITKCFVLLALLFLLLMPSALSVRVSVSTNGAGYSGNFQATKDQSLNGYTTIGATGMSNVITGTADLTDSHWVANKAGAYADVGVGIKGAKKPYTYSYSLYPGEGGGKTTPYVEAGENINVLSAAEITAYAKARNGAGCVVSKSIDVTDGSLQGYHNHAWASADSVAATQDFDTASGTITTNSGSFSWGKKNVPNGKASGQWADILPETGISTTVHGTVTNYGDSDLKSSGSSYSSQAGHVVGTFTSTSKSGTLEKTRASNYGTKYDFLMKASKSSSGSAVSGKLDYYVDGTKMWQGSPMTIQGGVNAAQAWDTVNVAAGTYIENVVLDKSLTVNGEGRGSTSVDGDQKGSVFTINPDVDAALSGMTITNGKSDAGGGIENDGTLTLNDVLITGNTAWRLMPHIFIPSWGGGVYNGGTLSMIDSSIADNTATVFGGGIYNTGTVNMYAGSSIARNTAPYGGGIYNAGTVNMNQDSSIADNTATVLGGGILNDALSTVNMNKGSSITGNIATYNGGGIYNTGTGTVAFKDSNGNPIAFWPGYDTSADPYGFFTPHNTPDDIYQA